MAHLIIAVLAGASVWLALGPPRWRVPDFGDSFEGWIRGAWRKWRPGDVHATVAELLVALSAELTAGQPLNAALPAAAEGLTPHPCPRAVRAAGMGGDVPGSLRADADAVGSRTLRGLAACWEVAAGSGVGMSMAVRRLAQTDRETQVSQGQLRAELAATVASGRLLALLPVVGLLLGYSLGADPLGWLFGGWAGRGVFIGGIACEVAGVLWVRAIVRSVQRVL